MLCGVFLSVGWGITQFQDLILWGVNQCQVPIMEGSLNVHHRGITKLKIFSGHDAYLTMLHKKNTYNIAKHYT